MLLDPMDIYDRALDNLEALNPAERFVFMLQDFDNLMEMEGWEHFFVYENHFCWYQEMKSGLQSIGDAASLAVLADYELYMKQHGVKFNPESIEKASLDETEYNEACNQWCDRYCELREQRWEHAQKYFASQGMKLKL